jgi:hypothetical protein
LAQIGRGLWSEQATQGDLDSIVSVGLSYLNGIGVEKNEEEAKKWLELAASNGSDTAQSHIDELLSVADDPIRKYAGYTPQQIADMPQELRSSELPIMYTFAAQEGLSFGVELLFSHRLNILMYSATDNYENAIKMFQSDLGEAATGELTVGQIVKLELRAAYQNNPPIYFPDAFSSYSTESYAWAEGTYQMLGEEKIAYPVNSTSFECLKSTMRCTMSQLVLILPDDDDFTYNFNINKFDDTTYQITSWSGSIIEAVPVNATEQDCRRNTLSFNFETEEFYEITMNGNTDCEVNGIAFPKLTQPRVTQLTNGDTIIQAEFNAIREKASSYLAQSYRDKMEAAIKEYERLSNSEPQ